MQAPNEQSQLIPLFIGKTTQIHLPSGRVVTIKESSGDDEDILSNLEANDDGSAIPNFLSSITTMDSEIKRRPLPEDIMNWGVTDKYALLFKQRIFNYGDSMSFKNICSKESCKAETKYTEDLRIFNTDLSNRLAEPVNSNALIVYPNGLNKEIEFVSASGKKFKYSILDGHLEKAALAITQNSTKNTLLVTRNFSVLDKEDWIILKHFGSLSAKEAGECRAHVKRNDPQFYPMISYTCPKCGSPYQTPLFSMQDFFYPVEMI